MHFGTVRRPSATHPSCHEYAEFRPRLTLRRCVRRVVASAYEKVRGRSKSKPGDTERTRGVGGVGPTYDKARGLSKAKPGIRRGRGAPGAEPRTTTKCGAGRNRNPGYAEDTVRRGRRADDRTSTHLNSNH